MEETPVSQPLSASQSGLVPQKMQPTLLNGWLPWTVNSGSGWAFSLDESSTPA
jgi:hypothetical protein